MIVVLIIGIRIGISLPVFPVARRRALGERAGRLARRECYGQL
jgi:hypothetical protein